MIDWIKEAYIEVMGKAKWNSLTDLEKHEVVMSVVRGAMESFGNTVR